MYRASQKEMSHFDMLLFRIGSTQGYSLYTHGYSNREGLPDKLTSAQCELPWSLCKCKYDTKFLPHALKHVGISGFHCSCDAILQAGQIVRDGRCVNEALGRT